jgi:hypothetical protein
LADGNINVRKYFLELLNLYTWKRNECLLKYLFSWIDNEDGIVLQKKSKKSLTVFPWRMERQTRGGARVRTEVRMGAIS